MTKIGLIRHGITDWNIERRAQGQTDVPLNAHGREQAKALANRLRGEAWDYIFASDLSRAKETADIVAASLGLSVRTDRRLREMYCGQIEGTTEEERIERWGADWRGLQLGIEDDESIAGRGAGFVAELLEEYRGSNILVVSHGALLGRSLKKLVPHANTEEHLGNTSVTILRYGSQWECELYNCAKHLGK